MHRHGERNSENQPNRSKRLAFSLAALTIITVGPVAVHQNRIEIFDFIEDVLPDKSDIVAGVPAQVEGRHTYVNGGNPAYHLLVEQCRDDITSARRGESFPAAGINEQIGVIGHSCIVDYILVDHDAYAAIPDGDIRIFGSYRDQFDQLRGNVRAPELPVA